MFNGTNNPLHLCGRKTLGYLENSPMASVYMIHIEEQGITNVCLQEAPEHVSLKKTAEWGPDPFCSLLRGDPRKVSSWGLIWLSGSGFLKGQGVMTRPTDGGEEAPLSHLPIPTLPCVFSLLCSHTAAARLGHGYISPLCQHCQGGIWPNQTCRHHRDVEEEVTAAKGTKKKTHSEYSSKVNSEQDIVVAYL